MEGASNVGSKPKGVKRAATASVMTKTVRKARKSMKISPATTTQQLKSAKFKASDAVEIIQTHMGIVSLIDKEDHPIYSIKPTPGSGLLFYVPRDVLGDTLRREALRNFVRTRASELFRVVATEPKDTPLLHFNWNTTGKYNVEILNECCQSS
jgi:hypothetical protein